MDQLPFHDDWVPGHVARTEIEYLKEQLKLERTDAEYWFSLWLAKTKEVYDLQSALEDQKNKH